MLSLELANLGACASLLWRAGHFSPQILHTRLHTAPIWNIFNGIESLSEKKYNCNNERKRLIGWCFMRI
jgi:hypothetical protein